MSDVAGLILSGLRTGETVFLPGCTGEVADVSAALVAGDAPALDITASFVPGINPTLAGKLPKGTSFTSPFAGGKRGDQLTGAMLQLPLSYGGFLRHVERSRFDAIVVQVAPPDVNNRASLGAAVEFTPMAMRRAARIFAVVNPNMPSIPGADSINLADAYLIVESDAPLREYDVGAPSLQSDLIAGNVADFIEDGAALQIGLGKVPNTLLRLLRDRKRLRLHSGMLSDGVSLLSDAGALDPDFLHVSCVHVGTRSYYEWLRDRDHLAVRGCDFTHSATALAGVSGLVAVNSALSVDLFGQANLEFLNGRAISGVGGAADFARAASLSADGLSIIALPATSVDGGISRIVARLDSVVSLPRHDIDVVVTEFGAADLRGASTMSRAERVIAVADPRHRERLEAEWREIARAI